MKYLKWTALAVFFIVALASFGFYAVIGAVGIGLLVSDFTEKA